jgi:hypothetical protein
MDKINIFLAMIEASANDKFDNEFNRVCRVLSKTWQFREAKVAAQQERAVGAPKRCLCGEVATINKAWCESCFPDTGRR